MKLRGLPNAFAQRLRHPPPVPAAARIRPAPRLIGELRPQARVLVAGMIRSTGAVAVGSGVAFHLTLVDGSGELDVLFLGRRSVPGLLPGARITAEGRVGSYDCKLALWNPRYWIEPDG